MKAAHMPAMGRNEFVCPYCTVFAEQSWLQPMVEAKRGGSRFYTQLRLSQCRACSRSAVWYGDTMLMPPMSIAPHPNPDMPEDIQRDFQEARVIVGASPRGAAALLRLVVQKLCKALGESGMHLNSDNKNLVQKGLDIGVQQSLDTVRVIGNHSVHPGQIDLRDDPATAYALFELVNEIVEDMISRPKRRAEMYGRLPQDERDRIANRDQPKA